MRLARPARRLRKVAHLAGTPAARGRSPNDIAICDPAGSSLDSKKRLAFDKRRVESFCRLEYLDCHGNRYRGHYLKIHPGRQTPMLTELSLDPSRRRSRKSRPSHSVRVAAFTSTPPIAWRKRAIRSTSPHSRYCETFDLFYRTLCAVMYNYAPLSGHPGGSISSGRFVARLLFDAMDYDLAHPNATRRRHHFLCGRAQGARSLCDVGVAQRNRAHRRA